MEPRAPQHLLCDLPAGAYALGISGHADSTALLRLALAARADCPLRLVHLDHELRGAESSADADFVSVLARQFGLPLTRARRSEIEREMSDLPSNPSARYRAVRHELFRRVTAGHGLAGVLLAHHADDQAETVLQRLLRGTSAPGLAGMSFLTEMPGLRLYRPLLRMRKPELCDYLRAIGQTWREDASNSSADYQRNRVRQLLDQSPELIEPLLELGENCRALRDWVRTNAPVLPEEFSLRALAGVPEILALESARRWLVGHGAPPEDLSPQVLARLVAMASDAAAPSRQHFPGGLLVRRRQKKIGIA
jgi:tRNA(Ile)-lysidine synthetase-like protein